MVEAPGFPVVATSSNATAAIVPRARDKARRGLSGGPVAVAFKQPALVVVAGELTHGGPAVSGAVTSIGASTTGIGFPTPFCLATARGPLAPDRCSIVEGRLPPDAAPPASVLPSSFSHRYGGRGRASHPARTYGASWRRLAADAEAGVRSYSAALLRWRPTSAPIDRAQTPAGTWRSRSQSRPTRRRCWSSSSRLRRRGLRSRPRPAGPPASGRDRPRRRGSGSRDGGANLSSA
jgi:hypothetical protein